MKYFEDFEAGEVYDLGTRAVSAAEIIAFARKYDPQPFHVDPEAAKDSAFGGLIASGWHTSAMFMSLLANTIKRENWASMGAPGLDTCRWVMPVRPGDVLSATMEVLELRRSKTRPFGILRNRGSMTNQDGKEVMFLEGIGLYGLRPGSAKAEDAA